jgi:dTDP-glucose 4,6-dehydratase
MGKTILITGAAGFVGSHLVEHALINTDWDIVALVKMDRAGDLNRLEEVLTGENSREDWGKRLNIIRHDINDGLDSIHKHIGEVDYIAHLAACSHVDYSIKEPVEVFLNNSKTTANMLEYARTHQPNLEKFLYFSTDEVYGPAPEDYDFTEEDKLRPSNPYSAGKAAGEMIVTAYKVTYGLPVLITNTMNIFGERQDPEKLIPKTMQKLNNPDEPMTVHGTPGNVGKRHWLHARNAADATLFLLQHPIVGEKVHIVGDIEMDNLQMVRLIGDAMGLGGLKEGEDYVYVDFHSTRPGHDSRYAMSGEKLEKLGWKPPVEFESSLRKTVKWTMEHPSWVR